MIHLVVWSTLSLSVPRALSNGRRSPVLSTAAARATQPPFHEPLTTQGRREVRTATNTGGTSVKASAQQGPFDAGLMRGFVHRTGVYSENKLWGPHGRYQSQDPEPVPNLKLAAVPPAGGSNQRSSWASQVAGGTREVMLAAQESAATDQEREGQTAVVKAAHCHDVSSAPRSIRLRHRLLRWWRWQRVCSTYTYRQGWEDGAWLFEHGGRTIAAAAAAAATRATNAATRAAAAARAAWCGFGRQRSSAPALSDGALPEKFPVLYAFFPERGMVKLTEQELKERCETATPPAIE